MVSNTDLRYEQNWKIASLKNAKIFKRSTLCFKKEVNLLNKCTFDNFLRRHISLKLVFNIFKARRKPSKSTTGKLIIFINVAK